MTKMTINEIKNMLAASDLEGLPALLATLEGDSRAGVTKLVEYYKKWYTKACAEKARLEGMLFFENKYAEFGLIAGVDEAGAGPLAGPVAAAAVVLPQGCIIDGLDDSKKLSANKREELAAVIREVALCYAVRFVDNNEIDRINILQARMKAMAMAVDALATRPDYVLFDGNHMPDVGLPRVGIQGGDSRSMSIAAASVLAKVERDALMDKYHEIYPEYGFDRHKGYGTAEHMAAITEHGVTEIHRRTFCQMLETRY